MTLALLLLAAFTAMWGFLAFAIVEGDPAPGPKPLFLHALVAVFAAPLLLFAAFLSWLFGG